MGTRYQAGHHLKKKGSEERSFPISEYGKGLKTNFRVNSHYEFIRNRKCQYLLHKLQRPSVFSKHDNSLGYHLSFCDSQNAFIFIRQIFLLLQYVKQRNAFLTIKSGSW